MEKINNRNVFKYLFSVFLIYSIYIFSFWFDKGKETGKYAGYSAGWVVFLLVLILIIGLCTLVVYKLRKIIDSEVICTKPLKIYSIILIILLCLVTVYFSVFIQQEKIGDPLSKIWLIFGSALISSLILYKISNLKILTSITLPFLITCTIYAFLILISPISNYPFSEGWSEGSRFYYGSLFFSNLIYGKKMAWPVLHPARYLLQSVPFAIGVTNILFHRIWQSLLWLVLLWGTSKAIIKRQFIDDKWINICLISFCFFYLLIGPVYYFLTLCFIPILLWAKNDKPFTTLGLVVFCSIWAGICRLNWIVVPAAISILLYIIEVPIENKKLFRYMYWPVIWAVAGVLAAYITNRIYIFLSGNPPYLFGSALESNLLIDRLFPNSTYSLGILLSSLMTFLPLLLVVNLPNLFRKLGILRSLIAIITLLVFYIGGIVVSLKIGGGSNLHNFDAFIVILLIIGSYGFKSSYKSLLQENPGSLPILKIGILLLIITFGLLNSISIVNYPSTKVISKEINTLQNIINKNDHLVLFISERQLLSTKTIYVKNFEEKYENVFLMEMVMSNNSVYLSNFRSDISNKKFSLIVTRPINANLQDKRSRFNIENNKWVNKVEKPVLESYKLIVLLPISNIEIYIPK